jgi:Ni/Fe-hydrogenase 1 B-type cytochrome subunit
VSATATAANATPAGAAGRVYVWELPVRLSHWGIALSIVVLAATGIYIGRPLGAVPGEANAAFLMGRMKQIHTGAAIVFTLSVLARIVWMFVGNRYARWSQLLPLSLERIRGLFGTFAFYSFLRRDPPPYLGHNPLAGFAYSLVFALCLTQIGTGLALYSVSAHVDSVLSSFQFLVPIFGGLQMARLIHHVVMWLLIGFTAHHVWSSILMSLTERNGLIDSIFSGFKHAPTEPKEPRS